MANPRTRVDVTNDPRTWDWAMPPMLRLTRDNAIEWYTDLCKTVSQKSEQIEAVYLGAGRSIYPDSQRQMAEAFDSGAPLPDDPVVLALAMTAMPDETVQWVRMFWALHGESTTLEAVHASLDLVWASGDGLLWAERAQQPISRNTTDFVRGLVNTLADDQQEALRADFLDRFEVAEGAELELWMRIFPGPDWAERLARRRMTDDRARVRAASMTPSHNDALRLIHRGAPVDHEDVEELVVNLLRRHGHGKTLRILEEIADEQPDLIAPVVFVFEETVVSVAACAFALRDVDACGDYLRRHPRHAIAACEALEEPTESQTALLKELRALPSPTETSETVSYYPLDWEVVDDELVAHGLDRFGEWPDVVLHVRITGGLLTQLDEDEPIAALDLLQPAQRETLQFVVAQWATIAMVAMPILQDNGATPLNIVVRADDEALVYGITATSETDVEHGLGIQMKALAVSEVGPMSLVL